MKHLWVSFRFLFPPLILALLAPLSVAQLTPSETQVLFQVQELLEYPAVLQGWTNWTNFCYLPPSPSLTVVCSNNRITELTVVGNKTSPSHSPKLALEKFKVSQQTLSERFSIDSFFTVLTKLSNLQMLSLVSLGLWGPLPTKINRFWSLQVLNLSSNFINGQLPSSITSLKNLRSLVLADNLFNGSVPDLKSLVLLQELNLGDNHLGPEFPSLSNSLVSIRLSNNSFRSKIPSKVSNFAQLQQFDISSNKILEPIPSFLFTLPSIQNLSLAKNQLRGTLPINISCNDELKLVDISHNMLTGKLPSCLVSVSSNRTVFYSWNCLSSGNSKYQHPYRFCHKETLAVKPPIKSTKRQSSIKLGLIVAIIGGLVAMAAILGLILVIVRRTGKRRDYKFDRSGADKMSIRSSPRSNMDARRLQQTMRLAATLGLPPYRVFTLEEIEDLTNNFDPSNLIEEGSQGQTYKGWLRDGLVVLVKCLKLKQMLLPQSLAQHMEVLSQMRHRHLVSSLGHCIVNYQDHSNAASAAFIVLEYVPNGSLRDYLSDWRKKEMLKWPQRMAITIGIARGVQFLHTGTAPGVFGNNLKIDNVLLDDSLTAKISSYNFLPLKVGSESPLRGQDNHISSTVMAEKEDIYQLGAILLEVITGKRITSAIEVNDLKHQLEDGLTESASKLRAATDPSIQGSFAYQSLKTTVEITLNCLCKDSSKRPSIEDLLWNLQYSIQVQEGWTSSGNLSTQM